MNMFPDMAKRPLRCDYVKDVEMEKGGGEESCSGLFRWVQCNHKGANKA